MPTPEYKTCTQCSKPKPHNAYYHRDGKPIAACKTCTKRQVAAYQTANRDKVNEWGRGSYQRRAESEKARTAAWARGPGKEKRAAISKRSRAKRADAVKQEWANWYARNAERLAAKSKANYDPEKKRAERTPEQTRRDRDKRRARLLGAYVEDTPFDAVLQRDEGYCGICGQPIMEATIELDHIIALAAGGRHERTNIQLAHRSCNRRKWIN